MGVKKVSNSKSDLQGHGTGNGAVSDILSLINVKKLSVCNV